MDFLNLGLTPSEDAFVRLMSVAAPYAPMDGMNEKGLCVAVLMIEDSPAFDQSSEKPDLTTTTAVRLLLDKATHVDEALAFLEQYDLHASANMMVHFALSDATGRSVVAEYVSNELVATETPHACAGSGSLRVDDNNLAQPRRRHAPGKVPQNSQPPWVSPTGNVIKPPFRPQSRWRRPRKFPNLNA